MFSLLRHNRLIKIAAIATIILTVGMAGIALRPANLSAQASTSQTPIEQSLIDQTNVQRLTHGLKPLTWNSDLYRAAEQKAADMFNNQYFDHVSPSGLTPWHFIRTEYRYIEAGENLAINFQDPLQAIPAWMNSPSHKANVLNGAYEDIAIITSTGLMQGKQTTIIVQMFGKPDLLQR